MLSLFPLALLLQAAPVRIDERAGNTVWIQQTSSGQTWLILHHTPFPQDPIMGKLHGQFLAWSDSTGIPLTNTDSILVERIQGEDYRAPAWLYYLDLNGRKVRTRAFWLGSSFPGYGSRWTFRLQNTLIGWAGAFNHRGVPSPWSPADAPDSLSSLCDAKYSENKPVEIRTGSWLHARLGCNSKGNPPGLQLFLSPWGSTKTRCLEPPEANGRCGGPDFPLARRLTLGHGWTMDSPIVDTFLSKVTPWGWFEPGKDIHYGGPDWEMAWIPGLWHFSKPLEKLFNTPVAKAQVGVSKRGDPVHRRFLGANSVQNVEVSLPSGWRPRPNMDTLGNGGECTLRFHPWDSQALIDGFGLDTRGYISPYYDEGKPIKPLYYTVFDSNSSLAGGHGISLGGSITLDPLGNMPHMWFYWVSTVLPSGSGIPKTPEGFSLTPHMIGKQVLEIRVSESNEGPAAWKTSLEWIDHNEQYPEPDILRAWIPTQSIDVDRVLIRTVPDPMSPEPILDEAKPEKPKSKEVRQFLVATVAGYEQCVQARKCPPAPDPGLGASPGWRISRLWPESIQTGLDSAAARLYCQFRHLRTPSMDPDFEEWIPENQAPEGWVVPPANHWVWYTLHTWCRGGRACIPSATPSETMEGNQIMLISLLAGRRVPREATGTAVCVP